MEGEKTGKKMSPEQVKKSVRKVLTPDENVTAQQVKSLYSKWAKLLKEGQLDEPKEKRSLGDDEEIAVLDQGMEENEDEESQE